MLLELDKHSEEQIVFLIRSYCAAYGKMLIYDIYSDFLAEDCKVGIML